MIPLLVVAEVVLWSDHVPAANCVAGSDFTVWLLFFDEQTVNTPTVRQFSVPLRRLNWSLLHIESQE